MGTYYLGAYNLGAPNLGPTTRWSSRTICVGSYNMGAYDMRAYILRAYELGVSDGVISCTTYLGVHSLGCYLLRHTIWGLQSGGNEFRKLAGHIS